MFHLAYVPNHRIHAPTVVFVPTELHYPHGYCARTTGARRVTSAPGSDLLEVQNAAYGSPRHRDGRRRALHVLREPPPSGT